MSEEGIRLLLCVTCRELKQISKHTLSVSVEIAGIAKCIERTANSNDLEL
jgi:hypothetical protein